LGRLGLAKSRPGCQRYPFVFPCPGWRDCRPLCEPALKKPGGRMTRPAAVGGRQVLQRGDGFAAGPRHGRLLGQDWDLI
jgi:hypothetical protein